MTPNAAANLYASIAQHSPVGGNQPSSALQDALTGGATGGFGEMVNQAISEVSEQAKATDQVTAAAVTGQADLVDVVTAISETELTMETLVGMRDRVINAYEQIMRMPI